MRVIFFGLPGVGKGTQARRLTKMLSIPHISTGDMLRDAMDEKSELGQKITPYMESGLLVPDDLVLELVFERLEKADCQQGYVLDGFPRTLNQAQELDQYLTSKNKKIDAVVQFKIDSKLLLERITGRRVCSACKALYHMTWNAPKKEGICDLCQGSLLQRNDDKEGTLLTRLEEFEKRSVPLLDYYQKKNVLKSIETGVGVEKTFEQLKKALDL